MNSTESKYATDVLNVGVAMGVYASWRFEAIKFRLADRTYYTPDFVVIAADGTIEIHEVKGFWEDDARVKIKVFAEMYPEFHVKAAIYKNKTWNTEVFE